MALLEGTASVVGALMLYKADALKASTDKKSPLELAVAADAASGYVQAIVPHISEADINKPFSMEAALPLMLRWFVPPLALVLPSVTCLAACLRTSPSGPFATCPAHVRGKNLFHIRELQKPGNKLAAAA